MELNKTIFLKYLILLGLLLIILLKVKITKKMPINTDTPLVETLKLIKINDDGTANIEYSEEESSEEESSEEEPKIELSNYMQIKRSPIYSIKGFTGAYVDVRMYDYFAAEQKLGKNISPDDITVFFYDIMQQCGELRSTGIPLSALLAQAYTEGGAGRYGIDTKSNNLFGIMAIPTWKGNVYGKETQTVYDCYKCAKRAGNKYIFRVYPTMQESIQDYITLITTSPRYKTALNQPADIYLKELLKNGYGERYMHNVWLSVIKQHELEDIEYD